jgi:hypothetical protein
MVGADVGVCELVDEVQAEAESRVCGCPVEADAVVDDHDCQLCVIVDPRFERELPRRVRVGVQNDVGAGFRHDQRDGLAGFVGVAAVLGGEAGDGGAKSGDLLGVRPDTSLNPWRGQGWPSLR